MSVFTPERRGSVAALAVAITIGILLVVLQPGPRPERSEPVPEPTTTLTPTTTLAPQVQLCNLASQFLKDAEGLGPTDVARIAERFFTAAVKLVDPVQRPDFDSIARYYSEFNAIGDEFDYDFDRIVEAGKGDRWGQLLFRAPAGIDATHQTIAELCRVELPAPPTVVTQPPTTFGGGTRPPTTIAG